MKYLAALILFCFPVIIFAQGEFGTPTAKIPPAGTLAPKTSTIKPETPSIFDTPPTKTDDSPLTESKSFSMFEKNDFVNPNKPFLDKLNKKEKNEVQVAIRKDIKMGQIKTKSPTVFIHYRDAEYVDGDMIRVYANQSIIRSSVILDSDFKGLIFKLEEGINTIDFEALNQGSSGPNTAEMEVFDSQGISIFNGSWNLATGFKASVIIVKE